MVRIVFMGSGAVAVPALEALTGTDGVEVVGVVSQPDRPCGRHRKVAACPARAAAVRLGLPTMTPEKVGAPRAVEALRALAPDLVVVADYGQYIPETVLKLPPMESINVHPSLLPRYRGATPVQWAIANGEEVTGVTILYVTPELDAGDMLLQESVRIEPEDTAATLQPRLAAKGAELLVRTIAALREGRAVRTPQDESQATYVGRLEKKDGRIDWTLAAHRIRDRVRGFYPWPCCHAEVPAGSGRLLRVLKAGVVESEGVQPGDVIGLESRGPVVGTGAGALLLLEVQPEGKKPMSGGAYLNGHPLAIGQQLG